MTGVIDTENDPFWTYYMENHDPGHAKFYRAIKFQFAPRDYVTILHWGGIGTGGTFKVYREEVYEKAKAQSFKQHLLGFALGGRERA